MKKQFQSNLDGMTLGGGSIEHPLSIHSASIGTRWKPRGMQLICTLVLLFTFGIGQMWAADAKPDTTILFGTGSGTPTYGDYINKTYTIKTGISVSLNHYVASGNAGSSFGGNNGGYGYINFGSSANTFDQHNFRISASGTTIDSIAFLITSNGSSAANPAIAAWEGDFAAGDAEFITALGETNTEKSYSGSVWKKVDLSSVDAVIVGITRKLTTSMKLNGTALSAQVGNSQNFRFFGVKIWLHPDCDDANASIIANTSVYVNDELDLEFSSNNTESVAYDIKKGGSATTDASVTAAGVFQAAVAGTYVVTVTQAKDASGPCAVEESVTITVNPKTPVESVSVAGAASGYKGIELTFTATAQYATAYEWYVDEIKQGSDSAKLLFTPSEAKTYSIVCKAKNTFNSDWIASSAHSLTVTSLYGDLIHFTAKTSTGNIDEDLPAANIGGIIGGTIHQKSQKTGKLGSTGHYYSLQLASGSFQAGDTVKIVVKPEGDNHSVPGTLMLSSLLDNSKIIGSVTGLSAPNSDNITADIILTTSASIIYLSRDGSVTTQNPIVVSMEVIRPMPVKSKAYDLTAVKINGTAISAAELANLKTADAYLVDLMAGYAAAPVVKFARQTTTTYEDDSQKVANDTITVTASEVSSKWQAQATIGTIIYTVKAAKQSSAKVYYYDGATKIGEETVAINGNPAEYAAKQSKNLATFVGWYNNADLAEEHKIADISELVVAKDTTVYGKWTYTYAQSVNVEKWVLDNSKTPNSDQTGALVSLLGTRGFASNLAYESSKIELDSLNDGKGTGRNYAYLGLKVKSAGKMLDFRLAKDNTVKVKFGNVGSTPLLAINGGEYANMTIEDGVFAYTATGNDYISIKTASDAAVVFQQIMIGEDIQDVTLPEPTRHAVVLTKAGETEHGTLAVASPEEYNWLAEGAAVTLTVAADEGYYIASVTLNGEALTPSENVYSFAMPNDTANVVATFAEIVPNSVTYMPNGATGPEYIVDDDATVVLGCPAQFIAPTNTKFDGWNTDPAGNGDAYAAGDPVLSPLQLYAQWKEYFVITYMDGETELDTEDVFVGEAPVGIADPVKAMNIFQGWTLAGSDEVIGVTTLTASTTVYAKWEVIDACFYFAAKSVTAEEAITAPAMLDNAYGGTVQATDGSFKYNPVGVLIEGGSSKYFTVSLNYALQQGSKIIVKMYAGGTSARGLNLRVAGSSSNIEQFAWTPSATDPAQMVYEEEYEVPENSPLIGKKVFYLYRNNNVYLQTVMVKDCAPQDYTVTYKDGETVLGTEQVFENEHPTADGINTHKKGYEFQGWAETVDGAVVDLDDITITAAKNLFAQYTVMDCSPKGVKFSMAIDGSKISANQYYPATTPAVGDLAVFATVTGGAAQAVNTSTGTTKNFEVKTTPEFKLGGNNSHMRILLDCPLAENDTIKFTKSEKIILSFDSLKNKKANIAKNTSYYIVPEQYAGEDTIHIWYDGSGVSVNGVQVIRPEIYTVSFNLMGHGSAIAPMDVVKGAKITAPTAPEDEDYAFAGWYKENTLSNAWDFDNDVVATNTTLYAKWLDMSDATLKSLKYGANDIALQDGVYEYNVELPSYTTAVPALTAETSNPNASAVVADAAAFDESGNAQSTVTVTPQKVGADQQVYTVNFTHAAALPQVDVTETTVWDFTNGNAAASKINLNYVDVVLANVAGVKTENINAQALLVNANYISNAQLQAKTIMFRTTVPGQLTIRYGCTSGKGEGNERTLYINDLPTTSATYGTDMVEYKQIVPAGEVTIKAMYGETPTVDIMNYRYIEFKTADYTRNVSNNIGTLCVDHNVLVGGAMGATFYQIASRNEEYDFKIDFEEVLPNEELKAGEPYIFQSTTGRIDLFYGETEADAPVAVRGMIGSFVDAHVDITSENMSDILYISQNKLWSCENLLQSGLQVVANRAYIDMAQVPTYADYVASQQNNGAPRRRVTMGRNGEQSATGFENLNASEKPMKLMINGQIFILRGEKMFDATGRLVK